MDKIFNVMFNIDTIKKQIELENEWFEEQEMTKKQQIRENFRQAVFKRDNYKCRVCGFKPVFDEELDAHHITDRNEMPNGGYVRENGISLCPDCHLKAEQFHVTAGNFTVKGYHPDDLYRLVGSSKEKATEASLKLI